VWPTNYPAIPGETLCRKMVGDPWSELMYKQACNSEHALTDPYNYNESKLGGYSL